jgi:hypothetical protein
MRWKLTLCLCPQTVLSDTFPDSPSRTGLPDEHVPTIARVLIENHCLSHIPVDDVLQKLLAAGFRLRLDGLLDHALGDFFQRALARKHRLALG